MISANFSQSYLRYQLFVMFNFEYVQTIKIRTSVSLQKTKTSESTLEPCNSLTSCRRNKIFFFSRSNIKRIRSWQNSGTQLQYILFYHLDQLIFVFTVAQKLLPVVTLEHILFRTCDVELNGRKPCFCLVIFLILSTLYASLINTNSFIVIELSGNMNHIASKSIFYKLFGFKHLIKTIPSINHAPSSGGIICNSSDSLMM